MMGERVGSQDRLFYEFCLEDRIPGDHFLRKIDAVLDLSWLRSELAPYYSHTGCPSVDPELLIRLLLVGYRYSIRSERRLCQEVELNLAYRWFCRLGLEDQVPNHSTFSVNRHERFRDSDILRTVFEEEVFGCMKAGLVGGEGFAVDASVIEADASRFARIKGAEVDWSEQQLAHRMVRKFVETLESENPPLNPDQKPKAMPPTDPCAAWTVRGRHKVTFGYGLNYLMDMENSVVLDVEATPTRISKEVDAAETMIERAEQCFGLRPDRIAGDVAYGTGEMLGWLVDHEITPHIPVWDQTEVAADGIYSRAEFSYDADQERRVQRDVNQEVRDYVQSLMGTDDYWHSTINRKQNERLFGEAKRHLSMTRLRLRGLTGARDEFLLTATVQNLKRLAKLHKTSV
jgi:transposase